MRIVDLSHKFSLEEYMKDRHSGTHIDAPAYVLNGGRRVGDFGLERFICDAVLLDLSNKRPGEAIDDEDLEAAEEAAGVAVREGEAVLLHTGVSNTPLQAVLQPPNVYLSRNGAEYLEFKGVSLVGADLGSIDDIKSSELVAHRTLLGRGIIILEGLCNLDAIDSERFRLASFPLNLSSATSPVRAVAMVD